MQRRELHHRRSIRLKEYNYSEPGFYFVTICVKDKKCILGKVVDDLVNFDTKVELSEIGKIVEKEWLEIKNYFIGIEVDNYVIMPNHIHGIIVINVGAIHELPLQRRKMVLSKIIGKFKMNTAKRINVFMNNSGCSFWQRNYYEHIIRNEKELEKIRNYIIDNPRKWDKDSENPKNVFS